MDNLVGQYLGPYRIQAFRNACDLIRTYKAQIPPASHTVTVAVIAAALARNAAFAQQFHQEVEGLMRLEHRHLVPIRDHGQAGDHLFLVLEDEPGMSLQTLMTQRTFAVDETFRIAAHVALALDYLHGQGVVHGDVRPAHIWVDDAGQAKLAHFGLVRMVDAAVEAGSLGLRAGSPTYWSPEQITGGSIDARSDIYSLGVVLYTMVTGYEPTHAATPLGTALQRLETPFPLPRERRPDLPQDVENIILQAVAREPDARFPTAGAMAEALAAAEPARRLPTQWWQGWRTRTQGVSRQARRSTGTDPPYGFGLGLGIVLLATLLLLGLLIVVDPPLRVQIDGGQLEVVRIVEATAVVGAHPLAEIHPTTTLPASPTPTPSLTPTKTLAPTPATTATPAATSTSTSMPAPSVTRFPTVTPPAPEVNAHARAFTAPLLAAIADRPPDFVETFDTPGADWTLDVPQGDVQNVTLDVVDGVARLALTNRAEARLLHPRLEATDFVLRVESRQTGGTNGSAQQVFLHFAGTHLNFSMLSGSRTWRLTLPWHPDGGIDGAGQVVAPMGETNETLLVMQQAELAVLLNGVPVTYLEEPNLHTWHQIALWCKGEPEMVCEFDNVQFWELR